MSSASPSSSAPCPGSRPTLCWTGGIWFGDVVEIDVGVEHVGRSSLRYRFAVTNAGSEAVSGSVTCVYVSEGRSAPIPDASRSALEGR